MMMLYEVTEPCGSSALVGDSVMVVLEGVVGGVARGARVSARIMYIYRCFLPTPLFLLHTTSCTLSEQTPSCPVLHPESSVLHPVRLGCCRPCPCPLSPSVAPLSAVPLPSSPGAVSRRPLPLSPAAVPRCPPPPSAAPSFVCCAP